MELRVESFTASREASPEPTPGPRNEFPGWRNGVGWLEPKDGNGSVLGQEDAVPECGCLVAVLGWLNVVLCGAHLGFGDPGASAKRVTHKHQV